VSTPIRTVRLLLLTMAATLVGCKPAGYLLYLFAPPEQAMKEAEFDGLAGRSVVVVVYTDQKVQYEYPYCRLSLSMAVRAELNKHVKDVTVVDPRRVVKYQDENIRWDSMDKTRLGRLFGADFVLYLVVDRYTMREPGSINLLRGRISAHASVYETSRPEADARVWPGGDFNVIFPRFGPRAGAGRGESRIRDDTEKEFAERLVKRFYKHEIREDK